MATNSSISVTEGSGKNIATYSISESTTKELQRTVNSDSAGAELFTGANPGQISIPASVASIGKAEDSASASADTGAYVLGIRRGQAALTTSPTSTAGDYQEFAQDDYGQVRVAFQAKTANPTAAADGNGVVPITDKLGKQVVVGSIRDLKADAALTLTSTTTETTLIAAIASTFNDVYGLIVTNISALACEVIFRDVTAGTPRFSINVPAAETRGFMLSESAAYKQATVNTAWTAQCGTSVASIKISALYVKNI